MANYRKKLIIICIGLALLVLLCSTYLFFLLKSDKSSSQVNTNSEQTTVDFNFNIEDERKEKIKILKLINQKASIDETDENNSDESIEEEIIIEEFTPSQESYSYNGNYVFLNNMNFAYLDESDWMIKYEDKDYISLLGLDISEYNGYIDFYSLKNQGFDFVMIRAGWRGSTEGGIYKDKYFEDYYAEAIDAGLNVGYYFFSQAINEDEAIEEANFVLDAIGDKCCDMFIAFDMETSIDGDGRSDNLSWMQKTNNAIAFSNTIFEAGYKPMIYTNLDWAEHYYDVEKFNEKNIPIWLAQYNGYPNVSFDYTMWQYTAKASLPGVSLKGRTDINLILVQK